MPLSSELFFPEIDAEKSSYLDISPLAEIIQDLKRRNVVTTTSTPGPHVTHLDATDPWGTTVETSPEDYPSAPDASYAGNSRIRTMANFLGRESGTPKSPFGYSSPHRTPNPRQLLTRESSTFLETNRDHRPDRGGTDGTPVLEGMNGLPSRNPRQLRLDSWLESARKERQHAEALLSVTPELRFIAPASTDMQGAGGGSSTHFLRFILPDNANGGISGDGSGNGGHLSDYKASLARGVANRQAAAELSSLLWILAHEMSLEDYGSVENEVFTAVFALIHSQDNWRRMAGLTALDTLIEAPSADEEKKAIKFANTLSNALRSAHGGYEFLSAISKALGHMATRTVNIDFVEAEVVRALEWLRTDRSDRRLAACLSLKEFAIHAPTTFHSKTSQASLGQGGSNEFLNYIFQAVRDPQPIVRACAADALSQCLKILMDRQHKSLTGMLCQVHFAVMEGLEEETTKKSWSAIAKVEATQHGSLLVVSTMIAHTRDFMLPRFDEICKKVLEFCDHPKALIRLEVIRLIPRLARRCPRVFARRYLERSLAFLLENASTQTTTRAQVDLRPSAFTSIGLLVLAMVDVETGQVLGGDSLPTVKIWDDPDRPGERHLVELSEKGVIYSRLTEIFREVSDGLKAKTNRSQMHIAVLHCAADLIEALDEMALPYIPDLIDDIFRAGLSNDLIYCLQTIAACIPEQQSIIEDRLLQEVSKCLAGIKAAREACNATETGIVVSSAPRGRGPTMNDDDLERSSTARRDTSGQHPMEYQRVRINMSNNPQDVHDLVLSLHTLGSFGDSFGRVATSEGAMSLLPFVQKVAANYLYHSSGEVRRAAALTCCTLLVPPGLIRQKRIDGFSSRIIGDVLDVILRVAASDPSPVVRLCVVRALDSQYDIFLCQAHHLKPLFLLLQDEVLATRAAAVRLLGRLASINPANILPYMRKFLIDLIFELSCGVDAGRGREEATRLLVVFLKAESMNRLVNPVLSALVNSLPLNVSSPRLASAALEALGELAKASGSSLKPRVKELMPTILKTLQDQSSASKQRTSLRTLSLIAGSTGYVIQPYIDYPTLLRQAADILPGTKRAPWALRREVIRTLGVLGALDPDRYLVVAPQTGKGEAVGGAYFVVHDDVDATRVIHDPEQSGFDALGRSTAVRPHAGSTYGTGPIVKVSSSLGALKVVGTESVPISHKASTSIEHFQAIADNDDDLPAHLSMYEQYAMFAQTSSSHAPPRRMTPGDPEFYPMVAIQALMRIFKDPSLANHHGMAMQAIMFIFKSLGLGSVPFLNKVVPHILYTIRTCNPSSLRESLLKQVATLSGIVRERLRPFVADIFDIVEDFWTSRHLETICSLILHLASGVPDEFKQFLPRLIRQVLASLDEMKVAEWASESGRSNQVVGLKETERLRLLLSTIRRLRGVLGEYLHVLIPAVLKLSECLVPRVTGDDWAIESDLSGLTVMSLQTVSALLECEGTGIGARAITPYWGEKSGACIRSGSLSARVVQPLIRMLSEKCDGNRFVGTAIVETLCVCAKELGYTRWISLYHRVARLAVESWQRTIAEDDRAASLSPGTDTFTSNTTGLDMYDQRIRTLQSSSLQRHYDDPQMYIDAPIPRRQDSLLLFGAEPLQPIFNENHGMLPGFESAVDVFDNSLSQNANKRKIDQARLQRAWDVAQCASRDDWDEWMRRLAIHLLREAPSPALRAAASLAHAYQPLARELFSAAFVCCWKELSTTYRVNLVHALETAFKADVSPEILQTLLNVAEFMEHDDDGGLPIDISILADLALKCRAYAKALHYREREHAMGGSSSCVEALISINRKLDLPEAALGVLKSATMRLEEDRRTGKNDFSTDLVRPHQTTEMYYGVVWSTQDFGASQADGLDFAENKELWLAKLGSWSEALEVYEEKLVRNPHDFDAILGCMRCLSASGEWMRVLELAEDHWQIFTGDGVAGTRYAPGSGDISSGNITKRGQKKALRICADAAWRLGQWGDLEKFSSELVHGHSVGQITPTPTASGGNLDQILGQMDFDGAFFSAVLHIHRNEWTMAASAIDTARMIMDSRFTALMTESYNRAYPSMVTAQTLAEMEEIIEFKKLEGVQQGNLNKHPANSVDLSAARERLLAVWRDRLAGCRVDADVHSSILAVRSLILGPADEVDATLTLSELSREAQRLKLAERVLLDPLHALGANLDGGVFGFGLAEMLDLHTEIQGSMVKRPVSKTIDELVSQPDMTFLPRYDHRHEERCREIVEEAGGLDRLNIQHRLYSAYVRHLWLTDRRDEAFDRMSKLCDVVDMVSHYHGTRMKSLRASCWLELGEWRMQEMTVPGQRLPEDLQVEVLRDFKRAITMDSHGYKAWHAWALLNYRLAVQLNEREDIRGTSLSKKRGGPSTGLQKNHVTTAIRSFVMAIGLGTKRWSASVQQDMLNLLTCLFRYGEQSSIAALVIQCVDTVAIDTWLGVLPQLLARIHIKSPSIRSVLHPLLVKLGEKHPQALIYPLSVLLKSPVTERKVAAEALMNSLRTHSSALVEEALMVSSELIRVAILWHETWSEELDEASRLCYGDSNIAGMLEVLAPLHKSIEREPETHWERDFMESFGKELAQAYGFIKEYVRLTNKNGTSIPSRPPGSVPNDPSDRPRLDEEAEAVLGKAWHEYYRVFSRINRWICALTKLELGQCSSALSSARSLELGVPGTYRVDGSYVKIEKFISRLEVINSKQRPRKITIRGSDGKDYVFLLKGHEDLRQDERVMQLFGLVNALLERDRKTRKHDLRIQRYAISPLSHNCGLVGWVPHTDTLHSLIRDYRNVKQVPLNLEHREMLKLAPDYDRLTVMQKVEVFTDALSCTTGKGNDLYEILWLKSTNSEEWLERRTTYTRSLAVMSMVGYILGLGDRHPSNLMLDKLSGRVLHIDFGDCFEVAMMREKFPEKVPFRLTRMLIKAMEVSGIEGSYRSTCERTMTVLRESRDSLVAVLEAFVYDPLISWRLIADGESTELEERAYGNNDQSRVTPRHTGDGNAGRYNEPNIGVVPGVPIELSASVKYPLNPPITEGNDEDDEDEDGESNLLLLAEEKREPTQLASVQVRRLTESAALSESRAKSLQIFSNMQAMAANLSTDARIASVSGDQNAKQVAAAHSIARSRMERSLRQRELLSLTDDGSGGLTHEEVLNEKALKVIRRVQDKLAGTDFPDRDENDGDPLDVVEQVQRLIVQATSVENLSQLFTGWCAFW